MRHRKHEVYEICVCWRLFVERNDEKRVFEHLLLRPSRKEALQVRYGEGWAYDSSRSYYKRAKPTGTDPENGRKADSTLPMGSTSKTYDPQNDYAMWQRKDGDQYWKRATSSGDQWKPRLRQDGEMSSVAGDASGASAMTNRLASMKVKETR